MKMPPSVEESTDNGIYEYQDNSLSISTEEMDNIAVEELDAPQENDFSEYMWMENEEEFDKEVMQKLEEEALMEQCIAYMNEDCSSEGSGDGNSVATSNLNPEAAEFVPSTQREDVAVTTNS